MSVISSERGLTNEGRLWSLIGAGGRGSGEGGIGMDGLGVRSVGVEGGGCERIGVKPDKRRIVWECIAAITGKDSARSKPK